MASLEAVTLTLGGRRVIDNVSLSCPPGSLTALIGPNGAGKSTLLSLMAGDLAPDTGRIWLDGRDLKTYSVRELAGARAVMPQDNILRFAYRTRDVVRMGRALRGLDPADDVPAVARAMRAVEIEHLAERNAMTLSGGEQARTTFARVSVQSAGALLLDEPTAALDLRHQERLLTLAAAWARDGHSVVAVMHDLNLAAAHADRIALLCDGRLAAVGEPWSVLKPARLAQVYGQPVRVLSHPDRGCPIVVPTCSMAVTE